MDVEFNFIWGLLIGINFGAIMGLILARKIVKKEIEKYNITKKS
jgi:uncharacterized protein YneF (UPF0154 family)